MQVSRKEHDYELTVLYATKCIADLPDVLRRLIEWTKIMGFTPSSMDVKGVKKLCYPINGEEEALYVDLNLSGQGDCAKLARALENDKLELRHLLIKC